MCSKFSWWNKGGKDLQHEHRQASFEARSQEKNVVQPGRTAAPVRPRLDVVLVEIEGLMRKRKLNLSISSSGKNYQRLRLGSRCYYLLSVHPSMP
jgi:hypothetical protein